MVPASVAPGVSSVGMMRAIAACRVARWCGSRKVSPGMCWLSFSGSRQGPADRPRRLRYLHPVLRASRLHDRSRQRRSPVTVGEGGQPVGLLPFDGGIRVLHECVEAVLVALWMAGGKEGICRGWRRESVGAARDEPVLAPAIHLQRVRYLGIELIRRGGAVEGKLQPVLPAG